jgi:hypothetical protein
MEEVIEPVTHHNHAIDWKTLHIVLTTRITGEPSKTRASRLPVFGSIAMSKAHEPFFS